MAEEQQQQEPRLMTAGEFHAMVEVMVARNFEGFMKLVELRAANPGLQQSMIFSEMLKQTIAVRAMLTEWMIATGTLARDVAPTQGGTIIEQ